jgi:hypothetical protein
MLAVGLSGCALLPIDDIERIADAQGFDPSAIVRAGGVGYVTNLDGDELQVVALSRLEGPTGTSVVASSRPVTFGRAVLITGGAAVGSRPPCCVFVYGTAGPDVQQVAIETPSDHLDARVRNGSWLVVLPVDDINPQDVAWRFVRQDGVNAASGTGPLQPGS